MSTTTERTVHSAFPAGEGTVAIISSDNVVFFVDRTQLMRASGFFRGMLDLPQPKNSGSSDEHGVPVPESEHTMEILLSLALADRNASLHELKTLGHVMPILRAAEKYDLPHALDVMRDISRTRMSSDALALASAEDLLNLHAVADRCEWVEIKNLVFAQLLRMRLNFESLDMSKIDTNDLAKLLSARQSRIERFTCAVLDRRLSALKCQYCGSTNNHWDVHQLLDALLKGFVVTPSIDEILKQPVAVLALISLNQMTCSNGHCRRPGNVWSTLYAEWGTWA